MSDVISELTFPDGEETYASYRAGSGECTSITEDQREGPHCYIKYYTVWGKNNKRLAEFPWYAVAGVFFK